MRCVYLQQAKQKARTSPLDIHAQQIYARYLQSTRAHWAQPRFQQAQPANAQSYMQATQTHQPSESYRLLRRQQARGHRVLPAPQGLTHFTIIILLSLWIAIRRAHALATRVPCVAACPFSVSVTFVRAFLAALRGVVGMISSNVPTSAASVSLAGSHIRGGRGTCRDPPAFPAATLASSLSTTAVEGVESGVFMSLRLRVVQLVLGVVRQRLFRIGNPVRRCRHSGGQCPSSRLRCSSR